MVSLICLPDGIGSSVLPSLLSLAGSMDQAEIGMETWPSLLEYPFNSAGRFFFSLVEDGWLTHFCWETRFSTSYNYTQTGISRQTKVPKGHLSL